jgi:hypothetical protein
MRVRRTRSTSSPARGTALAAVPLLLAPLAACAGGPVESAAADQRPVAETSKPSTGASKDPATRSEEQAERAGEPAGDPSPEATPALAAVQAAVGPLAQPATEEPEGTKKPGKLEGGGFATSVPGSDAPDRKVDVGPQYAVSKDLDIREIERLVKAVERIAKRQAVETPLATGGSLAEAVGTFSYRWFGDGTVQPDPDWVAANIRTESVPILGSVTGHRVLFPQLRGALDEVVARGLADEIHPEEFGGCYVPRFIARDPDKGLSLHTWGIAVDLNVPGNLRGVEGDIDREVVAIFKKWGFAWGGDWSYTDPMHFELAQIVKPR